VSRQPEGDPLATFRAVALTLAEEASANMK
jgi:hypothetical protein